MLVQKGQFWRTRRDDFVWIAFVFHIEGKEAHCLEYIPNGVVPTKNSHFIEGFDDHWKQIDVVGARTLIGNMEVQDQKYAYRMGKKKEVEMLAKALKFLERKHVSSVDMGDNVVRVTMDNGSSYEIAYDNSDEQFVSRQTGLADPW